MYNQVTQELRSPITQPATRIHSSSSENYMVLNLRQELCSFARGGAPGSQFGFHFRSPLVRLFCGRRLSAFRRCPGFVPPPGARCLFPWTALIPSPPFGRFFTAGDNCSTELLRRPIIPAPVAMETVATSAKSIRVFCGKAREALMRHLESMSYLEILHPSPYDFLCN